MIRKACMLDVPEIRGLVNVYADKGEMLAISLNNVYDRLRDFFVYEKDGKIIGTVALHFVWENLAEVRSLAVAEDFQGQGIARELVNEAIKEAEHYTCSKIFTLTYVPGFFEKLGFEKIDKGELPHKVWADCINCPKFPDCGEIPLVYHIKSLEK